MLHNSRVLTGCDNKKNSAAQAKLSGPAQGTFL
jgi:hypothetical protein